MTENNKPNGLKGTMAGPMQGTPQGKRKTGLSREVQKLIGSQLVFTYNEIVNQGVPDRFVDFIRRLEAGDVPTAPNPASEERFQNEKLPGEEDSDSEGS
jgi:hypothetical protein